MRVIRLYCGVGGEGLRDPTLSRLGARGFVSDAFDKCYRV
jgi:hypothetical protein